MNYRQLLSRTTLVAACLFVTGGAFAQTLQSIPFRANLSTANEVPPLGLAASGSATVWIHAVRSASGAVTEAVVDFNVDYNFPDGIKVTGLHIHRGIRGQNGPVVLDSGVRSSEPVDDPTGKAGIVRQSAKLDSATAISAINDLLLDPSQFYVNLHTTVNPGGAIRGQVLATTMTTVLTQLSPANEVPAIDTTAKGFAAVTTIVGRDTAGVIQSAEAIFDVSYSGFPNVTDFTGLHVHTGAAGINGPVTVNSGLSGAVSAPTSGTGTLRYVNRISAPSAATQAALAGLETNPAGYYINLHTRLYPGGVIRGQAVAADSSTFNVSMSPANEVPPIDGSTNSAVATYGVRSLRGADGAPLAAVASFDVYHRFPANTTFTGLHIHSGVAGQNGPVVIDSGIKAADGLTSASGVGNLYRAVLTTAVSTLGAVANNPSTHYINLHTSVNPGGAVRAQLSATSSATALPTITRVEAVVGGGTVRSDGLIRIVGTNLAAVTASASTGVTGGVPTLAGTAVKVGGQDASIRSVSPTEVVVQIPRNVGLGALPVATFPVIVTTPGGTSNVGNLVLTVSGN